MGKSILCVHGPPRAVNEVMDGRVPSEELAQMIEGVEEDIIICGHSHVPYIGEHNDVRVSMDADKKEVSICEDWRI